jgi:hypothetical protein
VNAPGHAATTLARLLAVDWKSTQAFEHRRSRVKLMKEYVRRAALWARELGGGKPWPFFDIAALIAPDVHPPQEMADQLEVLIYDRIGRLWTQDCCRAALRWAALLDSGSPIPAGLPDPYEPLLLMFERGGGFITEHGFIDVDGAAVPRLTMADYLSDEPVLASLDPGFLDALDALDASE